ncbi:uncharacterized protein [Centruroides vittatus]|uniref:uncharacterized protein n=1 Tax=Centruroides vittatus TaxID=120091 RepID=UPI00350EC3B6
MVGSFRYLLLSITLLFMFRWCAGKVDCLIDDEVGWFEPTNVYQCEDNAKCCKEYGNPSCCAEKDKSAIVRDQAILWGGLLGFLTVLGMIVFCRRSDFYVMESNIGSKLKCCGKSSEKQPLEETKENQIPKH